MTAGLLMSIGGVMLLIGIIVVVVNFGKAAKNVMNMEVESFAKRMIPHLLGGLVASGGGIALLGGFIWFLLEKFAK